MSKKNEKLINEVNYTKDLALFYFAYRAFTKQEDDLILSYGIRQVHRRIIFFVGRLPGLTVNELLEVLDITKQALNVPMNDLRKKELVEFKVSEQDKRIKHIYLTETGKTLEERMNETQITKMKQYFEEAGESSGKAWSRIMELYANEVGEKYIDRL